MKLFRKFFSILTILLLSLFLVGCGGGGGSSDAQSDKTAVNSNEDNYDEDNDDEDKVVTDPITPIDILKTNFVLYDWRKPRVYAVSKSDPSLNNDKIFSLRPHKTTISVKLVDYTKSSGINPANYTLRAVHTKDADTEILLSYDYSLEKWIKNGATVRYFDKKDIYPSYRIEAIDKNSGAVIAKDKIVLYDGGTNNCATCHASNSNYPLAYANNPANLADFEEDYKTNILRVHDFNYPDAVNNTLIALQEKGINYYNTSGLEATSKTNKITCTNCHGINGVQGSGLRTVRSLTNAIHKVHTNKSEPNTVGSQNCMTCHPGDTINKAFNGKIVHSFSSFWKDEDGHGEWVDNYGTLSCTLCHGTDLKGTDISGKVSCYDCHGKEW